MQIESVLEPRDLFAMLQPPLVLVAAEQRDADAPVVLAFAVEVGAPACVEVRVDTDGETLTIDRERCPPDVLQVLASLGSAP